MQRKESGKKKKNFLEKYLDKTSRGSQKGICSSQSEEEET